MFGSKRLLELIREIGNEPECFLESPKGLPIIEGNHEVPEDLKFLYSIAGGISLFPNRDCCCFVLPPEEIQLVGPKVLGQDLWQTFAPEEIKPLLSLYTIIHDGNGDYFSIDFNKKRLGYCYDTFHETLVGDCPMIATSFVDLLERLYANKGGYWYWLKKDFVPLGNAYDES
jgi:hypothetical protein